MKIHVVISKIDNRVHNQLQLKELDIRDEDDFNSNINYKRKKTIPDTYIMSNFNINMFDLSC